jgi:hypothetical protein
MASNANELNIFKQIDDLDNSKSAKELIAKLKPILAELAYYSASGDGAIMEMRENWHTTFTNNIRGESGAASVAANGSAQALPVPQYSTYQSPTFYAAGVSSRQSEELPSALNAIMMGTHISFKEK